MPLSILFVHQGFELYGSDRTLLQSVDAAAHRWPDARITVLLPSDGPLRAALLHIVDDVRIADLAILRKSKLAQLKLTDLRRFISQIAAARRMMRDYDVTYINTAVVMDFIVAAAFVRKPRIVHVHEIPTGVAVAVFSLLLALSGASLVFNSQATRRGLFLPFWQSKAIVWNGVPSFPQFESEFHPELHLLLIGRINSWKGQDVLLRAIAQLTDTQRATLRVRLVGGVFGNQNHFTEALIQIIEKENLSQIVEIFPFDSDPKRHYRWADVVAIPSTKPEPFGLVAIEAMAAGRSVIAAKHGGLTEIVVHGITGTLVKPGSDTALASGILRYVEDRPLARTEGLAGKERFRLDFEESKYKVKITNIIASLTKGNSGS